MATDLFAAALAETQTQQQIAQLLAKHPPAEQRRILAALIAPLMTSAEVAARESPSVRIAKASRSALAPMRTPRANGAASSAPQAQGNLSERIRSALREKPYRDIGDIAKVAYGADDETNRGKVRSLLSVLKKRGEVVKSDAGWKVVGN